MLIDTIYHESKDFRSLIAVPFGFLSRTKRSIINGTLCRVAFNVAIYNAFACTVSIYLILNGPSFSRYVWNSMSLPICGPLLLPFGSIETLPIYVVCVGLPLLFSLGLFVMHRYCTRKVQESELDRLCRGGDQDEESEIEENGLAIEFILTTDNQKKKMSIFMPVSKTHTQGKILDVIYMENFDKRCLACIPYVFSCTIVIISVGARCYLDDGIQQYLLITFIISLLIMVVKSLCIFCMEDNEIDHKDNYIHGIGYVNIFPIYNIFCTFKEAKMAVVVKNKGRIDKNGLLSMFMGDRNASSIEETLKCSSAILSKISKEKNILTGITGPNTAEEIQSVLSNLNNVLKKGNVLSWIMGQKNTEEIESFLSNLNNLLKEKNLLHKIIGPEDKEKLDMFIQYVSDLLQGNITITIQTNCIHSLFGLNARVVCNPRTQDSNASASQAPDAIEKLHTQLNDPKNESFHGSRTGGQTSDCSPAEPVSVLTVGRQSVEDGSEESVASKEQPQEEEVKNIRDYLSEYLGYIRKGIKFQDAENPNTVLTLDDIPVTIVVHKINGSEIVVNASNDKNKLSSARIGKWVEGGIISAKEVECINAVYRKGRNM